MAVLARCCCCLLSMVLRLPSSATSQARPCLPLRRWRADARNGKEPAVTTRPSGISVEQAEMEAGMQIKLLHEHRGERTFAVILQNGDEPIRCLQEFAVKERVGGAQITAIGAFSKAKLAFFDWEIKQYLPIAVDEQVEVASLVGDIAIGPDRQPSV